MTDMDTIIEKVNRLMAIAEDDAASDNEIELAYGRAQRLIDKYRLENWRRDGASREPVIQQKVRISVDMQSAHLALAGIIGKANDCITLRSGIKRGGRVSELYVEFVGVRSDVEASVLLFENMQAHIAKRCRDAYLEMIDKKTVEITGNDVDDDISALIRKIVMKQYPRRTFYMGYRIGFTTRIKERFNEARTVMLNIPTGRELTTCKKERVARFIDHELNVKGEYKPRPCAYSGDGYDAGLLDAGTVGMGLDEVSTSSRRHLTTV